MRRMILPLAAALATQAQVRADVDPAQQTHRRLIVESPE